MGRDGVQTGVCARLCATALRPASAPAGIVGAAGLLNKLIADRLGAAETTVKIHRGRVMEKMGADSVADLARMSERFGLQPAPAPPPE